MMEQEQDYYYSEQEQSLELDYTKEKKNYPTDHSKKKKGENSVKRFSDEQVKSLESMFGQGTKIEPRKKIELARNLGLQPRQVSIWFQNKRARWKSKQIEQEYGLLRDNFDDLNQQFKSLKEENESLLQQVQTLRSRLRNSIENGVQRESENGNDENCDKEELKEKEKHRGALYWDDDDDDDDDEQKTGLEKGKNCNNNVCVDGRRSLASSHSHSQTDDHHHNKEEEQYWCNFPTAGDLLDESSSGWWNHI